MESKNRRSTWGLERHQKELKERFLCLPHRKSHVWDMCISEFELKQMKELKKKKRERQDEGNPEESDWTSILFSRRMGTKQMGHLPTQGTTIWQQMTVKTSVLCFWGYGKCSSNEEFFNCIVKPDQISPLLCSFTWFANLQQ